MAHPFAIALRSAPAVLLLGVLSACGRAPQPEAVPAPEPDSMPATPPAPAPDTTPAPAPSDEAPPGEVPAAPDQPESTPPPPEEPSPVPKPTASPGEPAVGSMRVARASSKISVPVSLRYQFDAPPAPGRPVTLHLAAVPRSAGSNLKVSVSGAENLQLAAAPLRVQKATAADVYRQQWSVTRPAAGPQELLVLVTMDTAEGSGFGYFAIPLDEDQGAEKTAQNPDSVKQR
ncbi:MAG TPA: hypothetical protein VFP37_14565 [Steroidobacteraceae bacterium]|nr:hypothetical protein [Steroidobacteraceae bacterium]